MNNSLITDTVINCQRHPQKQKLYRRHKMNLVSQNVQTDLSNRDVLLIPKDHFRLQSDSSFCSYHQILSTSHVYFSLKILEMGMGA